MTRLLPACGTLLALALSLACLPCAAQQEEIDLGEIEVTGTDGNIIPESGDAVEINLGTLEVEGRRQPSGAAPSTATTVIDRSQFGTATSVAEILERIPGTDVRSLGGSGQLATVHIRGSRANQALVLIDGLPAASGAVDLSALPLEMAQRIEVYRGPAAARFGGGAMGGVVNIVTTTNEQSTAGAAQPATALEFSGGSHGYYGTTVEGRARDAALFLSHQYAENDYSFTRADGSAGKRGNNQARIVQAWGSWQSGPANYMLGLSATERGVPGSAEFPTLRAGLNQQRLMFSRGTARQLTGLRITHNRFSDPDPFLGGSPIDTEDTQLHFEHAFTATRDVRNHLRLKPQLDYIDSSGYGEHHRAGLDAGWNGSWTDGPARYDLELGAVASEGVGIDPVGRVGATLQVDRQLEVFGSAGFAVRHPDFDELYLADMGSVRGNPELEPERVASFDAGFRLTGESTLVELSGFLSDYHDSILFVPVSAYAVEATNTGKARVGGVELLVDQHLGGDCWWRTAGTWLPLAEYDSGVPLSGRSEQHVNSRLELAGGAWSGALEYDYTGNMPADLFGNLVIEPRSLVNLELTRELPTGSAGIAVRNVFGEDARDSWNYPLPGREIQLTWRIEL